LKNWEGRKNFQTIISFFKKRFPYMPNQMKRERGKINSLSKFDPIRHHIIA
jgi:hypothetical protein